MLRLGFGIVGFESHQLHQSTYSLAIHLKVLIAENSGHAPVSEVGMLHVNLIDPMHEPNLLFALLMHFDGAIDARSIDG